jgi:ribosomal RNA methyltransferase Nop2
MPGMKKPKKAAGGARATSGVAVGAAKKGPAAKGAGKSAMGKPSKRSAAANAAEAEEALLAVEHGLQAETFSMDSDGGDEDDDMEDENVLGLGDDSDNDELDDALLDGEEPLAAPAPAKRKNAALVAPIIPAAAVGYAPVRLGPKAQAAAAAAAALAAAATASPKSGKAGTMRPAPAQAPPASRKMALMEDSDEEGEKEEEDGSEEEDDEDGDEDDFQGGDIEAAAKRFDAKRARIAAEADAEMRLNAGDAERFVLPSADELEAERANPPNISSLKRRIHDLIFVLTDFKARREPLRSRSDYMEVLGGDMAEYFGYNRELIDVFAQLFSPSECLTFLEENDKPRPVTIRVNTLKAKRRDLMQALIARGCAIEPVGAWTKVGLKVLESPVPIGATPEYLAGHYMLQSAASLVPVTALAPQPGEKVLDMASAPGGKTSHLAQLMGNAGVLVANDLKKERLASLTANLARLGVSNTVITCMDGRALPTAYKGTFDRVLLDAPCSGLGVLARDTAARTAKGLTDVLKMAQLQVRAAAAHPPPPPPPTPPGGG